MAESEHAVHRLQALDLRAAGLRVARDELPERRALDEHAAEVEDLGRRRLETGRELEGTEGRERQLEGEVAEVAAKAKAVEQDLYSGRVRAPKELEALQAELHLCRARQRELEELELELMEAGEALTAELEALAARQRDREASISELHASIAASEARIDAELASLAAARDAVRPEVEPSLLAVYEKRRGNARLAGVITTRLDGNACGRCRVALPVVEVTRIRREAPHGFAICTHCQRVILA